MHVKVKHLLPAFLAVVGEDSESALARQLQALLRRKLGSQHQHFTKQWRMLRIDEHQGLNVIFGNQQKMHRRPRIDVVKGVDILVFVDLL